MDRVNLDEFVRSYWKLNNMRDAILNIADIIRYN